MKNLMKVISVLLFVSMIIIIIPFLITKLDTSFLEFYENVISILSTNLYAFIAIALCCYCLERNDENYFTRIIPFYMCISIFISIIVVFFFQEEYTNYLYSQVYSSVKVNPIISVVLDIQKFMVSTHPCLALISLLFIIKPNNQISDILKKVAYGVIIVNVVISGWITIKEKMEEKLPNVYNYKGYDGKGFNYLSISDTKNFAGQVYVISLVGEVFVILLLFTTNYAFSSKIEIDADEIDFDALKLEANELAKNKIKQTYSINNSTQNIQNGQNNQQMNTPPANGFMNISNQLGVDSNVGASTSKAIETNIVGNNSLDEVLPLSGPVVNETIAPQPQPQVQSSPQISNQQQETQQTMMVQNETSIQNVNTDSQNKFLN